jgi:hypothetical protein
VVEATFCAVETLKGWKQGEVMDYVIDTGAIVEAMEPILEDYVTAAEAPTPR